MIGQPTSPRVLQPVIAGRRGCALRQLYALRGDARENEAVLAAAQGILGRYQPDPERQAHLVARIDDPRHADHWRGWHIGTSQLWFEDALSAYESDGAHDSRTDFPHRGGATAAVRGQHPGPRDSSRDCPLRLGTPAAGTGHVTGPHIAAERARPEPGRPTAGDSSTPAPDRAPGRTSRGPAP